MKNRILCFLVCGVMIFFSCQEEERELIDPNTDTTIPVDSQLAGLMTKVSIHDGSYDDIVDRGNCFSVNLPYSILLDGQEYTIDELGDYNTLSNTNRIEISFPITVTLSNHTIQVIENLDMLIDLRSMCQIDDDDIECIDFLYPITFSTFDSVRNRLDTKEVDHDSEMFQFMSGMDQNVSVSINYPIQLVLHNQERVEAQHNSGLEESISEAATACDEGDVL